MSGTLFNQTPFTLIQEIKKGHFTSWPRLTNILISKHLSKTIAMANEHLNQDRMNLQSTKITNNLPVPPPSPSSTYDNINPPQDINNKPSGDIMCMVIETSTLISKSCSNQTGYFPARSSQGNDYIFIFYHYDTNSIHALPLKNRKRKV